MSFLTPAAGAAGATGAANGLGRLFGADPSRISSIANSVGTAANGIAQAGGATQGYANPQQQQPNNYLQFMDPSTLQAIMAKMGGQPNMGGAPISYRDPGLQRLSANLPGYAQ